MFWSAGGVNISDTSESLRKFLDITGFPTTSTLMGMGCVAGSNPQFLGMLGMHGTYAANIAITECDLLISFGVRFDDRVTGSTLDFAPKAKLVHFDIDPAEINKNVRADLKVIGDLQWSLPLLVEKISSLGQQNWNKQIQPWTARVQTWKREEPLSFDQQDGVIMPQAVIEAVSSLTNEDSVIVTDVGQHQMWTAQFYNFLNKRSLITSGGLGTMGYGLPAAIGAQIGLPEKRVILFTGDGSIMMNCQELATVADNDFPLKIIVMNNQVLGMVNQWQRLFYGKRYSHTILKETSTDFVKLAEAMGVPGLRITKPEELAPLLDKALNTDGPVLVEVLLPDHRKCSADGSAGQRPA